MTPPVGIAATSPTAAFIGTRLAVLFSAYMAVSLFGYPTAAPFRISASQFWNLTARWDSGWYLGIASDGYQWNTNVDRQQNIAFFPAYPMLMRGVGRLIGAGPQTDSPSQEGRRRERIMQGAMGISLIAFWWALVYLMRLARDDVGSERAGSAVLLLASYPFALFFSAVYTEGLFLLAAVAAMYHFRREQLLLAGIWGLVAGLSRPNGCFLSIPLGIMALGTIWPLFRHKGVRELEHSAANRLAGLSSSSWSGEDLRRFVRLLAAASAPGIGMLLFSAYIYSLTGDPFRWAQVHAAWGREYRGVLVLFTERYDYITFYGLYEYVMALPIDFFNSAASLLVILLIWPVTRRFGLPYGAFLAVNIFPPLAAGGTLSMGRVTSVLFPVFLYLAAAIPIRRHPGWIVSFAVLQGLCAALFFTWRPLY